MEFLVTKLLVPHLSMDKEETCERFTTHPVRKFCKNCQKTKEDHPLSEEDVENVMTFLEIFSEQPKIQSNEQYAWTPPYCPINRLDEYFEKFKRDLIPTHRSTGQKNRLKRLVFQIPLSDVSLTNCRFVEPAFKEEFESYTQKFQKTVLQQGIVKEVSQGMPVQCPKCLLILKSGELVVTSAEKGSQAFHPACFVCFQCGEALADLIHCLDVDGTIFCVRHYGDNIKKRCHTCDELIFSAHYSLAGDKYYHKQHLLCFSCDNPLTSYKGFSKDGELYCASCYESQFCSDCIKCQKKITLENKHIAYRDKNWHYECFTCTKCDTLLSDHSFDVVEEDLFLCSECYNKEYAPKCDDCKDIFEPNAKIVKYEGNIFHVPCFKCVDCQNIIGTSEFVAYKSRVYCKSCHVRNFGIRCFRCRYTITDDKGIEYNKQPYHEDCFTCSNCSIIVANRPFKRIEDDWFCMNCYAEKFCKKCHSCDKPILLGAGHDILYSFRDYRWHTSCFICSLCESSLADTPFVIKEKLLVCKSCCDIESSEKEKNEENSEKKKNEENSEEKKNEENSEKKKDGENSLEYEKATPVKS